MRCPKTSHSLSLFLLLLAPDVHNRLMGQQLYSEDLRAYGEATDRNVTALLHIAQSAGDDLLGGVISVVVADRIVVNGGIEELGEHPSGADRHHTDISSRALELAVRSA